MALNPKERDLVRALQDGLPLTAHPFRAIGERVGLDEDEVIRRIARMQRDGVIKRVGVVVRHRELGYRANAMVVWDVPDERVDETGEWLGHQPHVTLCYRRPRVLPRWPYNLFCMIHGRDRAQVREQVNALHRSAQLARMPYAVLFSTRCFKQRGACYHFDGDDDREKKADA